MQQQRCFAEGAVATQTTVWDELGSLVSSDEGKRELAALRSTYADIAGKLANMAKVRIVQGGQSPRDPWKWQQTPLASNQPGAAAACFSPLFLPTCFVAAPRPHRLDAVEQGDRP